MTILLKKVSICNRNFAYIISVFIVMLSLSSFTLKSNVEQEAMLTLTWMCVISALQISTSSLFTSDYHDGILEQIFIQPISPKIMIIFKIFAHWLLFGLPISIISSIFSFLVLGNNIEYSVLLGLSLLLSTFMVISISAVGNALMIGGSDLVFGMSQILILPITIPVFIYFKLLVQIKSSLSLNIYTLLIIVLIFAIITFNSIIATDVALKCAVEHD